MSEDSNQLPGEPEQSGQPLNTPDVSVEPSVEHQEPPEVPASQPVSAPAESIIPEQPRSEQFQYPPSPEYYAQMPVANPYAAPGFDGPPPYVPSAASMPTFPPPSLEGRPAFPPPAYGYGYGHQFIPQAQPLPLGQAIRDLPRQYKKILFKPGMRSFAEEQGRATWGIIWMQLLFLMLIQLIVGVPMFFIEQSSMSSISTSSIGGSSAIASVVGTLFGIALVPLIFFGTVGVQYLVAKMFKGTGSFKQQAYNYLLFSMPLQIVSALLGLIIFSAVFRVEAALIGSISAAGTSGTTVPNLGLNGGLLAALLLVELVALAMWVYGIVLNVFSLMAAHRMSGGKATGAVLIPYGVLIFLFLLCYCGLFFIILSNMPGLTRP